MKVNETKVYLVYEMLTPQERKDFLRFLKQHSQPKRGKLRAAAKYLNLHGPRIAQGLATNAEWWAHVFPDEPYASLAMRKHQNSLLQDLEAFMIQCKWLREPDPHLAQVREVERILLLLGALQDRSRDHLFRSYARRAEALLAGLPRDSDRYALELRLEWLKISDHQKLAPSKPREGLLYAQIALDHHYVLSALKLEVALRNELRIHPQQPDLGRMQVVLGLQKLLPAPPPLQGLYLRILDLHEGLPFPEVADLLDHLVAVQSGLVPDVWKDLLYCVLNFGIRRINEGLESYQALVFRIYLLLLDAGLLQKEESSFKHNFLNLVKLAFACEGHQAIAHYVLEQRALIAHDPDYHNMILFYESASLFARGDYAGACDRFWKLWMLEPSRKLRYSTGIFLLKSRFEARLMDDMPLFAMDFKRLVLKDKGMSPSKKDAYREFFKAIQRLGRLQFQGIHGRRSPALQQLQDQVTASPQMIAREWLMEKIAAAWNHRK